MLYFTVSSETGESDDRNNDNLYVLQVWFFEISSVLGFRSLCNSKLGKFRRR